MRALTVERALAQAHAAGGTFRLAGARVSTTGLHLVPEPVVTFLRDHREEVFAYLGERCG